MGEKKKTQNALSFLSFFFSLSLARFLLSFFLSFNAFSLLLYARNREDILIEREKKKERKRDISIQQKHNNDDAAAVYCLPTDTTYTTTVHGKKCEEKKKKYECARTSMNELCAHKRGRRKRRKNSVIHWQKPNTNS
jgi:hypothetical protein